MSRRKWITAGLAGAALLAGAAASGRAQAPAGAPPAAATPAAPAAAKPPAVVNGEVVGKAELDDALKQAAGPNPAPLTEDQRRGQAMQVSGMLIDDKLMHQFIAKNAAPAPPAEVTRRVAAVEAELKKQNKTLQDFYKESGQTEMTFRGDCAMAVQWDDYAKSKISDADVEKLLQVQQGLFRPRDGPRQPHPLAHPAERDGRGQGQAERAVERPAPQIVANQLDFAEAAKKYSQCPTAPGGGDIGYFPRKFMVDEAFAQAAFSTPVNGVSEVVQSGYGFHLIKVTDRKAGEPSDFAKMKDAVREVCTEEWRMNLLEELRRTGKIDITLP